MFFDPFESVEPPTRGSDFC